MNEKRFFTKINKNGRLVIIDKECHIELIDLTLACEVLNRLDLKLKTYNEQLGEQQATINKLKSDIEETEISIKLFEDDIATKDKKIKEQQATINELQSIINHIKCEGNCFDYDYCCETVCSLYNEIKHLKEENEQLQEKLKSVTMLKDDYKELIESFEKKYGKNIEDVIDDE